MAPTSERTAPTKKSLRIWVRNNGHVMRKKTRISYVYPRTVEAAKDPFECTTGKNKMFFLIAINLFPDSKIIRPDDSDSETEIEESTQNDMECNVDDTNSKIEEVQEEKKQRRSKRSPIVETSTRPAPESLKVHKFNSENNGHEPPSQKKPASYISTKSSCQRQRLLPLKKTGLKTENVENYDECSKVSGCENCLSSSEPDEVVSRNKSKGNETVTKGSTVLNARKLPAIPTIMNSLNKIIETCSASGVVSFSLAKKKPRQSRS